MKLVLGCSSSCDAMYNVILHTLCTSSVRSIDTSRYPTAELELQLSRALCRGSYVPSYVRTRSCRSLLGSAWDREVEGSKPSACSMPVVAHRYEVPPTHSCGVGRAVLLSTPSSLWWAHLDRPLFRTLTTSGAFLIARSRRRNRWARSSSGFYRV